jgi:hypothetical protein
MPSTQNPALPKSGLPKDVQEELSRLLNTGSPLNLTEAEKGFLKARSPYLTPAEKEIFFGEVEESEEEPKPKKPKVK